MISKAIIRTLRANTDFASLCGGSERLFAEIGQGEPTVIIKQNGNAPIIEGSGLRVARIQLLVSGYGIDEGEAIAEAGVSALGLLEGVQITDGARQFTIRTVTHLSGPALVEWKNVNALTANFTINFHQVTT